LIGWRCSYRVQITQDLNMLIQKFSEHYHDAWAGRKLDNAWQFGDQYNWNEKIHPRLKPYHMLTDYVSPYFVWNMEVPE